jgi:hypothetical protein
MLDVKEYSIQNAKRGWERFKIKNGLTELPADYAFLNIQDFLTNREDIEIEKLLIFPEAYWLDNSGKYKNNPLPFPIKLKDKTGEIEAFVRPTTLNRQSGGFTLDQINGTGQYRLHFLRVSNGMVVKRLPYEEETGPDTRLYLIDFKNLAIPKPKFSVYRLTQSIENLFPDFSPELNPIRI